MIDEDPTTLFANYASNIGTNTRVGLGYFENTTLNATKQGGVLNFAQAIDLSVRTKLVFGANLFGFQQEITNPDAPQDAEFLGQLSLGTQLMVGNFSVLAALDNALDFNFSTSNREANERLFKGALSYDIPLQIFSNDSGGVLRPIAYYKVMPEGFDDQYGLNALFSTSKFWVQGGYNSFYGPSGGLGATFFKRLSIGGLVELPIDDQFENEDPTFEVLLSYRFGPKHPKTEDDEDAESEDELEDEKLQQEEERLRQEADSLNQVRLADRQRFVQDSIAMAKEREAALQREQQRLDSIANAEKETLREENDVYSSPVQGLAKGYYLIVNVYSTEKYFTRFMATLRQRGLNPNSFYREANGYKYVYLQRYDTLMEAINARDSNLNGKYKDRIWIFEAL